VVGSLNMDVTVTAPRLPRPGETLRGETMTRSPGGKGANQAVAAARVGAQVSLVGRVGRDEAGRELRAVLDRERIDTVAVGESWTDPTGMALICVEQSGENFIVAVPGANGRLQPGDIDEARGKIESASVLLVQFEVPLEAAMRAAELARGAGSRVVLNVAPARSVPADLLRMVDVAVVNLHEANVLTGRSGEPDEGLEGALRGLGLPAVVMTLGKRGAILITPDDRTHVPVFDVDVVDAVGAGDAFIGSMGAEWALRARGARPEVAHLPEVLRVASAAGSLATTKRGAIASMPRRNEIDALLG
jgi:ribokinase